MGFILSLFENALSKATVSARTDIVVIGAGHNGLVCAGYLAKAGLDVVVVERSGRIGGACVTEELIPGFRFSTFAYGAHGPGPKICRDLEIPANAFVVLPLDPTMLAPYPDGDGIILWSDIEKTAAGLDRFGPGESEGFLSYSRFMDEAVGLAEEWFLSPPMTHGRLYERYRGTPRAVVLEAMLTRSHWDVLGDYVSNQKVKCALSRSDDYGYPTAVGSLLAEAVESASNGAGVEGKRGVVRGGMGEITGALALAAQRFGAEIRLNCPVEKVEVEGNRAVGVRLAGGESLRCRRVVSNADPKRTFLKLVDASHLDPGFRRQVERIKTRASYMKYHAALSGVPRFPAVPGEPADDPPNIGHVRILPSLEYAERAWLDAQSGIPARDPVMSLQIPTLYDPQMAPPGKHIFRGLGTVCASSSPGGNLGRVAGTDDGEYRSGYRGVYPRFQRSDRMAAALHAGRYRARDRDYGREHPARGYDPGSDVAPATAVRAGLPTRLLWKTCICAGPGHTRAVRSPAGRGTTPRTLFCEISR